MKFFFDNNLAAKLAHGISQMVQPDHEVVHLRDKFAPNEEDVVWMKALAAEEGWVIVTADVRISRNPHEVRAWRQAGHTIFFLKPGWTDLTFWEQAKRAARSAAFIVTVNGKIEPLR